MWKWSITDIDLNHLVIMSLMMLQACRFFLLFLITFDNCWDFLFRTIVFKFFLSSGFFFGLCENLSSMPGRIEKKTSSNVIFKVDYKLFQFWIVDFPFLHFTKILHTRMLKIRSDYESTGRRPDMLSTRLQEHGKSWRN